MTDLNSATRARIVEIAMKALDGCYLHQGRFGDTAAGMVADALMKEMPVIRHAAAPDLHPSGPLTEADDTLYDGDDLVKKTHPGFTVTCDACGSQRVEVENSFCWSEVSGSWGSVDLHCLACDARVAIMEGN